MTVMVSENGDYFQRLLHYFDIIDYLNSNNSTANNTLINRYVYLPKIN